MGTAGVSVVACLVLGGEEVGEGGGEDGVIMLVHVQGGGNAEGAGVSSELVVDAAYAEAKAGADPSETRGGNG